MNIIGWKYENGLLCDLFVAETQTRSWGLYHLDKRTISTEFRAIFPKICGNFQTKNFITQEIRRKSRDKIMNMKRCEHGNHYPF